MTEMKVGDKFPDFKLLDENGEQFDSAMLIGVRYVIYFYEGDNDEEGIRETLDFNSIYPKLMLRNVPVIGVSGDDVVSHQRFILSNGLKIKLLADTDHDLTEKVCIHGEKGVTSIINKEGMVEAIWYDTYREGHTDRVYERIRSIMKL